MIFEKLFETPFGSGYPSERASIQQNNKKILDSVKIVTHKDLLTILENIDQDFLKSTIDRTSFKKHFSMYATNSKIKDYIIKIIND